MSRSAWLIVAFVATVMHPGCSRDVTIAGGGSDLPDIRGQVVNARGEPVGSVQVLLSRVLITAQGDSALEQISMLTDNQGAFACPRPHDGTYVLYCDDASAGAAVNRFEIDGSTTSTGILRLSTPLTVNGRLVRDDTLPCRVTIPGTALGTPVDAAGAYTLQRVPQGRCDLAFVNSQAVNLLAVGLGASSVDTVFVRDVAFVAQAGSVVSDRYAAGNLPAYAVGPMRYSAHSQPAWYVGRDFTAIAYYRPDNDDVAFNAGQLETVHTLIDDFEDGDRFSLLHAVTASSFWFAYNDEGDGGASTIGPNRVIDDITRAITIDPSGGGSCLHLTFTLNSVIAAPFANLALELSDTPAEWTNLSAMTAISFRARGNGVMRLMLVTSRVLNYPETDSWGHPGYTIVLEPDWRRYHIDATQLAPPGDSPQAADGLSWQACADSVDIIAWCAWDPVGVPIEFWLDDVAIDGMLPSDFR